MVLTYPRQLPDYLLADGALDLIENVAMSPSGAGAFMNLSQVADPVWRFRLRTVSMYLVDLARWVSWKKSLRGGFRSFIAYDPRWARPLAYPLANSPGAISPGWAGTGTVAALGAGGVLSLSSLPVGYQITAGDRIGIEQGGRRGYYEALESVTADAGGAATVTVAPFLHAVFFSVGALARLWRPTCELIIDWQTWREEGDPNYIAVSFEAWQKL